MNQYASIVMYAFLDFTIKDECIENGIEYKYNRREPIEGFVSYMRKLYDYETARPRRNYSPVISKAQLWSDAVKLRAEERLQKIEQARVAEKKQARKDLLAKIGLAALFLAMIGIIILEQYLKARS